LGEESFDVGTYIDPRGGRREEEGRGENEEGGQRRKESGREQREDGEGEGEDKEREMGRQHRTGTAGDDPLGSCALERMQ